MKQCFKNIVRDTKTLPGVGIDSDHNLPVAEVQTWLKEIKKAGKRNPKWNFKKIKSKEKDAKEMIEQKFCQIDGFTGSVEDR